MISHNLFPCQKTSKRRIFGKSHAGEASEKVGNLAMEIYSMPSMFYITGVKAYNHLSSFEIGFQSRQYAKMRTTGPCLVYYLFP